MKKACVCVITQCLVALALLGWDAGTGWSYFERFPKDEVERLREDFKDTGKLKEYLERVSREHILYDDIPKNFKRHFGVSNEVFRDALTGIFRGSSAGYAITWLCACTDEESKKLLLDIAMDGSKDWALREIAAVAYLRRTDVDAQDTKDFLAWLDADETQLFAKRKGYIASNIRSAYMKGDEVDDQKCMVLFPAFNVVSYIAGDWDFYEQFPEEKVRRLREDFKDPKKLKEYLTLWVFPYSRDFPKDNLPLSFTRKFIGNDAVLGEVLVGIIREPSAKDEMIRAAIEWLCACTDKESKKLLLDIAMDDTKEKRHRNDAMLAYLRRADVDAQDAKDFLARLDTDEPRFPAKCKEILATRVWMLYENLDIGEKERKVIFPALKLKVREKQE